MNSGLRRGRVTVAATPRRPFGPVAGRVATAVWVVIAGHRPSPVITVGTPATFTCALAVEVSGGSLPEAPPPAQATVQVMVAVTVKVPSPDPVV